MIGNIKEGTVAFNGIDMQYVVFGKGMKPLIILPGLSDGIRTVKGTGLMQWFFYRHLSKLYRIWVFSRKNVVDPGMTTRDMAREQAEALDALNIENAYIMGVSQGGMIAQWLAIDFPQKVGKLLLFVTLSRQNRTINEVVGRWIDLAAQKRYGALAIDTIEKTFTEKKLKKWRVMYWFVKRTNTPVSKERFLIQAKACINHDAFAELKNIACPTMIIGGGRDKVVGGPEVQQEMAKAIPDSRVIICPEFGHDAFLDKSLQDKILNFFT